MNFSVFVINIAINVIAGVIAGMILYVIFEGDNSDDDGSALIMNHCLKCMA